MSEYAERDIIEQGQDYIKHVSAMTYEGLHSKSAIAAEMAHRDIRIRDLEQQIDECDKKLVTLDKMLCAIFARRVKVEEQLMAAAKGKAPLPDADECARLAAFLGVPNY